VLSPARGVPFVVALLACACGESEREQPGGASGSAGNAAGAGGSGNASGSGGSGGSGASGGAGGTSGTGSSGASGAGSGGTSGTDGGSGGSGPSDAHECATPQADWVFCSDFEEGNKDVWDDYDGNPDETNALISEPGPFGLAQNHAMRLRVPAGRGGADLVKLLPSTYDKLYTRWYVKYEPGFDFDAPNHGGGLHAGNRDWLGHSDTRPAGNDWFSAWIEHLPDKRIYNFYTYYRGMYQDCVDPNGSCWGDHFPCTMDEGTNYCEKAEHRETVTPPALEAGRWYCVELMVDGGTATPSEAGANGALAYWLDGQQFGPYEHLWFRTDPALKLGILWLSVFHHEAHSVEGLMFDHVVVSTSRVGCL